MNLDISPYDFELLNPDYSFNSVKWSTDLPAENFSFFSCRLKKANAYSNSSYNGFVYWPHPSTKPEFHQNLSVLEVVAPFIPNLSYGSMLELTRRVRLFALPNFENQCETHKIYLFFEFFLFSKNERNTQESVKYG